MPLPSLSTRQRQVLELLDQLFDGSMEAKTENYRRIARELGISEYSPVIVTLQTLRAKGRIRSEGRLMTRPDRWLSIRAETNQQHEIA